MDKCNGCIFMTDMNFTCLSVIDSHHGVKGSIPEIIKPSQDIIENSITPYVDELENSIETAMMINKTHTKVTEKHLKTLQCPFTWSFESNIWKKNINNFENKYGKYNTDISMVQFSFEKYINNLLISCELFKTNKVDKAHDKLIDIWNWLDKLEDANEPFYLSIRDGLKHIIMSTLCYVLYTFNKVKCQQLFEMIKQFNTMHSQSRATVQAIHAAVCIEIGDEALKNAVFYAKKACDLDSENAYWKYFYSVAMTAQRQYQITCKSCPTEIEFDLIQQAIIYVSEPNPYFNFHRMNLMKNKILYHYHLNNIKSNIIDNPSEQAKHDFCSVSEMIKAIISMEPRDPHLVLKCAKALITLPYFNLDNIHLIKQISSIAVNMAHNDSTVIQKLKENIDIYKRLINNYKEIVEKQIHVKDTNILNVIDQNNKKDRLENDFKLIVNKHKKGSNNSLLDLINLLDKYDEDDQWKIIAQICSHSILFQHSVNLKLSIEHLMKLISNQQIAFSDVVTDHTSIFFKDQSKVINLAELVCNEIKLTITFGDIKNPNETQFYLDHLTKIIEVCKLKSTNLNPKLRFDVIEYGRKKKQNGIEKTMNSVDRLNISQKIKPVSSKNVNQKRRSKQTTNINTRVYRSKAKMRNHRNNV